MPTEEELLSAIDADPHADAPRLAHADWLEANGNPERAAYIRSSLSSDCDIYRWDAGLPCVHGMEWVCRRGYPEVVRFRSLAAFKKGWPLTTNKHVRHVVFSGLRGGAKLAEEPALASINSLEMTYIDPAVVLAVLQSPHLGPLHHLAITPRSAGDSTFLPALVKLPLLAGLRSLHCSDSSDTIPEQPIAALVSSPHLSRLRELRFNCWLGPEALRALWRSSSLSGLAVLEILRGGGWGPNTRPGGLEELGEGAATPNLERFRFEYPIEEKEAGLAVAKATCWSRLRVLDLSSVEVGDAGAAALAGASHLYRLESLHLPRTGISDDGAIALASSPHLRSLSSLDLSRNVIGRAGVTALGRSEQLTRLRALSLTDNPAPAGLIAAVEARFRDGGPPIEEAPPALALPAVPAPSAPVIGAATEDGLVRAIWSDPFDDVPRLIYADWLEEQGKPIHAAILRVEPAQRPALAVRLNALIREDAPCVVAPVLTEDGLVRVSIPVRSLRSKVFEERGPAWLRQHHVAEVSPSGTPVDWARLFAADWLAHTRGLSFQDLHYDALPALAASPHLAALASLTFGSNRFYPRNEPLATLFREAELRGLCRLSRPEIYLPKEALKAICEAPFAANLRYLATGVIQDQDMAYLSESPALAGLVTLALGVSGDSGVKILADATGLGSLRNLDLSRSWFTDVGMDALAGSPLLGRLRRLHIVVRHHHSTPALERLAQAALPHFRLVVADEVEVKQREALAAILGERLILE